METASRGSGELPGPRPPAPRATAPSGNTLLRRKLRPRSLRPRPLPPPPLRRTRPRPVLGRGMPRRRLPQATVPQALRRDAARRTLMHRRGLRSLALRPPRHVRHAPWPLANARRRRAARAPARTAGSASTTSDGYRTHPIGDKRRGEHRLVREGRARPPAVAVRDRPPPQHPARRQPAREPRALHKARSPQEAGPVTSWPGSSRPTRPRSSGT